MDFDLFISHKTIDEGLVTQLAAGLELAGIRCYVDHLRRDYNNWKILVPLARDAPAVLLLLTPNSCDDQEDNIFNEVMAAKNAGHMVIPVRTPDVAFGQGDLGCHFMGYDWILWDPATGVAEVAELVRRRLDALPRTDDCGAPATAGDVPLLAPPPKASEPTFTVHTRTPRVSVSLKRDAPGYRARKAVIVRRFGLATGNRWALTQEQFEEFARLAQSEH